MHDSRNGLDRRLSCLRATMRSRRTMIDLQQTFAAWRAKHARRAWRPVVEEGGELRGARFGGAALLADNEDWPSCVTCRRPMQFFLQFPLSSLPPGTAHGEGILQLFYCSTDDGACETWWPFSGTHLVRLLTAPSAVVAHPLNLRPMRPRAVTGWTELVDYPHPEEHPSLGLTYDYDFQRKRVSVSAPSFGIEVRDLGFDAAETIGDAVQGDKLGGWPAWVQSVEYPACTVCGREMALVFQLDSENNVDHMFGDAGCGHITQCREHPEVLAFGWACS